MLVQYVGPLCPERKVDNINMSIWKENYHLLDFRF